MCGWHPQSLRADMNGAPLIAHYLGCRAGSHLLQISCGVIRMGCLIVVAPGGAGLGPSLFGQVAGRRSSLHFRDADCGATVARGPALRPDGENGAPFLQAGCDATVLSPVLAPVG